MTTLYLPNHLLLPCQLHQCPCSECSSPGITPLVSTWVSSLSSPWSDIFRVTMSQFTDTILFLWHKQLLCSGHTWCVRPTCCYPVNPRPHTTKVCILMCNSWSASHGSWCIGTLEQDNYSTVGGDGGCRVGKVQAGTTSPMPDKKGFKLQ